MSDRRADIVCFSINEWADVPRNQIQLMRVASARGYKVLYVETVGLRRPELSRRDLAKIGRRLRRALSPVRRVASRFWVLSPLALPIHGYPVLDALNERLLGLQVRVACRVLGFRRPILWSYLPQTVKLARSLDPSATIYFRCDEYTEYRGVDVARLERLERDAVAEADICLASAKHYLDGVLKPARRALWLPNAVDLEHYRRPGPPDPYAGLGRPILLMMGTLEYWLATELLRDVARLRPSWTIVLAGPLRTDLSALDGLPNVRYVGVVDYAALPAYMRSADVGIIPFRRVRFIEGASPGKVFQFLAAGKPVVVTRILDPEDFGDLVYFADETPEDFVRAVEQALAEDTPERRERRRRAMEEHTWERRFSDVERALASVS